MDNHRKHRPHPTNIFKRTFTRRRPFFLTALLALCMVIAARQSIRIGHATEDPAANLETARQAVEARSSYHFNSDIVQTTIPAATLQNIGNSSREERFYIDGNADLSAQTMWMTLRSDKWRDGGSVLLPESGLELEMADGKTRARQAQGKWEDLGNFTDGFAPNGNFLSFLIAAQDVVKHDPETRNGITFTRYTFNIDGPTFARHMREQTEAAMRAGGELPSGLSIQASSTYVEMTGSGELWLAQDGLPLRQTLDINFPGEDGERTHATIKTDFSAYGELGGAAGWLPSAETVQATAASLAPSLLYLTVALLFITLLFVYRRSRTVERGLAYLLIFSMVFSPLLHALGPLRFLSAQTAQAQAQEEAQEESEMEETIRKHFDEQGEAFDPQHDQLADEAVIQTVDVNGTDGTVVEVDGVLMTSAEANARAAAAPLADFDGDGLSDAFEAELGTSSILTDTDGDSLDDFQELSLGTMPIQADSDGDQLTDKEELVGYFYHDRTWYLNPLEGDTNGDGLSDAQELGADTNGDGKVDLIYDHDNDKIPNIFDNDNDGDGVPDRIDTAPMSHLGMDAAFNQSNPFKLTVNGLVQDRSAYVDLQIRPTDEKHLWYAFNILDWPLDEDGQIQDWNGGTFASQAKDGINPPANQSHGDMRLVPMLEVRVPTLSNTNLPSAETMKAYNVTINDLTDTGLSDGTVIGKVVYIPLSLVNHAKSGERVAFSARLPLSPDLSWTTAHEMRMVWAVHMMVDYCEETAQVASEGVEVGDCIKEVLDKTTPIHMYDDDFYITGLNVREDIGARMSMIYEDPAIDPDLNKNDLLWALADGFDEMFLQGRDDDNNGFIDLNIDVIQSKFDHRTNGSAPNAILPSSGWGLPNYAAVERGNNLGDGVLLDFASLDLAVATMTMTKTEQLLEDVFSSHWSSGNPIMPTVMYASENSYRGLSLDDLQVDSANLSTGANGLLVNFAAAGAQITPDVVHNLKWTPYCGDDASGEVAWKECSSETYWEELDLRFEDSIANSAPSPEVASGQLVFLKLLYMSLSSGTSSVVYSQSAPLIGGKSTEALLQQGLALGGQEAANQIAKKWFHSAEDAMRKIGLKYETKAFKKNRGGMGVKNIKGLTIGKFKSLWRKADTKLSKGGLVAGAVVVVGALVTLAVANALWPQSSGTQLANKLVVIAIGLALSVVQPIVSAYRWTVQLVSAGAAATKWQALKTVLLGDTMLLKNSQKANMIGAAIIIAIAWGFFIASVVSNGIEFGSPEFNRGAAAMLALTLVIVVLAILASNPIGLAFTVLLALVDGILEIICAVKGEDDCSTVTGEVTKFVAKQLYSYDLMIENDPAKNTNLRTFDPPNLQLNNRLAGYIENAELTMSLTLTTSIYHRQPKDEDWKIAIYSPFFNESNFKSSSYIYSISEEKQSLSTDRDDMSGAWQGVTSNGSYLLGTLYKGYKTDTPTFSPTPPQAGINQPFDYYFNSAYDIPAYECWLVPNPKALLLPVPICYVRDKEGNDSSLTTGPIRDILPATIDGFMALTTLPNNGHRLAWDDRFPEIWDADGDGLFAGNKGGVDPNDTLWDTDGDGVSDFNELKQRNNGVNFSPQLCDTDLDGLTDMQELELGTHPARADTDNDGIDDGDEVYHRVIECGSGVITPTNRWEGGYQIAIAPHGEYFTETVNLPGTILVTISSDPTERDADGDSIPDDAEKTLYLKGELDEDGHPFNPNVFNEPPLKLYVAHDVDGTFVGPNQAIAYTNTVTALTDFEDGVLQVDTSQPINDGLPTTYALPAFTANTSSTIRTDFTVASSAATQPLIIQSTATARITPLGPEAPWVWNYDLNPNLINTGTLVPPRNLRSTFARPDHPGEHLFATLFSDATDGGRGNIELSSIGGQDHPSLQLDQDSFFGTDNWTAERSEAAPDIACNDNGICMTVWEETEVCQTITINWLQVKNMADPGGEAGIDLRIRFKQDAQSNTGANGAVNNLIWARNNMVVGVYDSSNDIDANNVLPKVTTFCSPNNATGATLEFLEKDGGASGPETLIGQPYRLYPERMENHTQNFFLDDDSDILCNPGGFPNIPEYCDISVDMNITTSSYQRTSIKGRLSLGNASNWTSVFTLSNSNTNNSGNTGDFFPSVASDGDQFMVVWNRKIASAVHSTEGYLDSFLQSQLYDSNGARIGSTYSMGSYARKTFSYAASTGALGFFNAEEGFNQRNGDLVPTIEKGSSTRYRVAWQTDNSGPDKLESIDLSLSGEPIGESRQTIATDVSSLLPPRRFPPELAYHPTQGTFMHVYTNGSGQLMAKLYSIGDTEPLGTFGPINASGWADSPSVAYYPPSQGWLISWLSYSAKTINYSARYADGTMQLATATTNAIGQTLQDSQRPLSCAAPESEPFIKYDFEELPGTTLFDDSSGYNNDTECSGNSCPTVGIFGAGDVVQPFSDRAVQFDGVNDMLNGRFSTDKLSEDFTLMFWMKTDDSTTSGWHWENGSIVAHSFGVPDTGISIGDFGLLKFGVGDTWINSLNPITDGEWHHVAVTRESGSGAMYLYVDGVSQAFTAGLGLTGQQAVAALGLACRSAGRLMATTSKGRLMMCRFMRRLCREIRWLTS